MASRLRAVPSLPLRNLCIAEALWLPVGAGAARRRLALGPRCAHLPDALPLVSKHGWHSARVSFRLIRKPRRDFTTNTLPSALFTRCIIAVNVG
jgi:hypothetical protein